jgi:mRNA-degrading endonuclease toxin of MazEF toxin-antitoxin module
MVNDKGRNLVGRPALPQRVGACKKVPVLVIQSNAFNFSNLNTVICVGITSNMSLAGSPANIQLEKAVSKLPKPSVANFSQILTVDKSYFISLVSMVPKTMLERIDGSIKIIFDVH